MTLVYPQMAASRLPAALQATEEDLSLLLQAQAHIGSVRSLSLPHACSCTDMRVTTAPRTSRRRWLLTSGSAAPTVSLHF
jgi:hypothetical protein